MYDAAVIGGGFFGATLACYLARRCGFRRIVVLERDGLLLGRASYNNQARVHNGYHYPRSFTTAYRSRINLPRFMRDYSFSVKQDFLQLYAIAGRNSKVTARQFERFCREIGARLTPAPKSLAGLFDPSLIEAVFLVEEYAFDAARLRKWAERELADAGVELRLNTEVVAIRSAPGGGLMRLTCRRIGGEEVELGTRYVFNCAYSGLNQIGGEFRQANAVLKHEITEMALVQVPPILRELGITVMDGPYFSVMPFPPRDLHTFSHVRYTPHCHWFDRPGDSPYARLAAYEKASRFDRMVRDAGRYLPTIVQSRYVDSLFEIKTVLAKSEGDDGRPILYERCPTLPDCFSILGGKIDNVYDVLEQLDREDLPLPGLSGVALEHHE